MSPTSALEIPKLAMIAGMAKVNICTSRTCSSPQCSSANTRRSDDDLSVPWSCRRPPTCVGVSLVGTSAQRQLRPRTCASPERPPPRTRRSDDDLLFDQSCFLLRRGRVVSVVLLSREKLLPSRDFFNRVVFLLSKKLGSLFAFEKLCL